MGGEDFGDAHTAIVLRLVQCPFCAQASVIAVWLALKRRWDLLGGLRLHWACGSDGNLLCDILGGIACLPDVWSRVCKPRMGLDNVGIGRICNAAYDQSAVSLPDPAVHHR